MTSYSSSWMELKSKACVGWLVPHVSDILQSSRVGLHVWQRGPARGVPLFFHEKAGRRRAAALPFSVFSPAARISIAPFGGTTALSCCRPLLCCSILVVLRYAPRRTDRAWIHGAIHAFGFGGSGCVARSSWRRSTSGPPIQSDGFSLQVMLQMEEQTHTLRFVKGKAT